MKHYPFTIYRVPQMLRRSPEDALTLRLNVLLSEMDDMDYGLIRSDHEEQLIVY